MLLGIDHLVIAVVDPDAAAAELEARLGLAAGGGGRHDALGTFNRLVWLGDTYLELIGVFDPTLAAGSWVGAPTLRALERGGGVATVALATDDIEADTASLRSRGSDLAAPMAGERTRPDGRVVRWRLAVPPTLGPDRPPFLIEHDAASAEWTADDRNERANGPARLRVLELAVDDVNRTSQSWLRTAGLRFRPSLAGGGGRDADVGSQTLRLRPRRRPVAAGPARPTDPTVHLSIRGASPTELEALGLRWRVGPSPDPG
jgi:Glyoxalase-like domain